MITDTKSVWAEVLSSQRAARRWHELNPDSSPTDLTVPSDISENWLDQVIQCLSDAHTLGGVDELSFTLVPSSYSDMSFKFHSDIINWRWDTYYVGPKMSSEILSQHLIIPLVSTTHLAFTSVKPVSEMSEGDLEKAIDKVGRSARRGIDTHTKNAIMRPRVSTTLRRMTALLDFNSDPPNIVLKAEGLELKPPAVPAPNKKQHPMIRPDTESSSPPQNQNCHRHDSPGLTVQRMPNDDQIPAKLSISVKGNAQDKLLVSNKTTGTPKTTHSSSETEPESGEESTRLASIPQKVRYSSALATDERPINRREMSTSRTSGSARHSVQISSHRSLSSSDSDPNTLPPPPRKKAKPTDTTLLALSDEGSDEGGEHIPVMARRGTRQPIRRGGRRF